jgi:hypothetical protein
MGHHVRYLLSFRSITAVIVLTDGGLDVGACAVGGRTNHTCSCGKPIKKRKRPGKTNRFAIIIQFLSTR